MYINKGESSKCINKKMSYFALPALLSLANVFFRLGTANSTANLLDDVEGNPCGKN